MRWTELLTSPKRIRRAGHLAITAVAVAMALPAAAQQCVAHWPLDGSPLEAISGDPGALVGGGVSFSAGVVGDAASFDGASHIDAGANPSYTDFADTEITLVAWIRQLPDNGAAGDPDAGFISARTSCNLGNWQAYSRLGSTLYFSKWEPSGPEAAFNTPVGIPDGVWSHVAISVSNNEARFYVNGVLAHTGTDTGSGNSIDNIVQNVQLGWDSCGSWFTGDLDDVAVYDGALDAGQILDIYTAGLAGTAQCQQDPQTKADCKGGGWADFGFKNQGQCIRYVNTGKDSR